MSSPTADPVFLESPWTLWVYDPSATAKKGTQSSLDEYNNTLKKVFSFETIQVCLFISLF